MVAGLLLVFGAGAHAIPFFGPPLAGILDIAAASLQIIARGLIG